MAFTWTKHRIEAAQLVADDDKTDEAIAAAAGVSRMSLHRWKRAPEFQARVASIIEKRAKTLAAEGIANKRNRLTALQTGYDRLEQVIAERAADPSMQDVPGGRTGIVIRQYKQVGFGKDAELVVEYAVDTPTLKERRATLQQAAQELGEWVEKSEGKIEQDLHFTISFDRLEPHDHL